MGKQTTLEKNIEYAVARYARLAGVLTWKFTSPGTAGVPDRIFMYKGLTLFLEFKRPGGKVRKLQEHRIRQIRDQHLTAFVCNSFPAGKKAVDAMVLAGNDLYPDESTKDSKETPSEE